MNPPTKEEIIITLTKQLCYHQEQVGKVHNALNLIKNMEFKQRKEIKFDDVVNAVANEYGIRPEQMKEKTRKQPMIFARHMVVKIMRDHTKFTNKKIGELLNRRDHSTILSAYEAAQDLKTHNLEFQQHYENVITVLAL